MPFLYQFLLRLLDISSYLRQILLHVLLVAVVDDLDDFFHLSANLLHLPFGVGVEEDFAQQGVIFGEHSLGNLHVTLEGGAWGILVLHHGSEGEGGDEGDGERVGHGLVVFLEGVFEDVEAETRIEVLEEATSHVVTFVDDDGILITQFAEVGKSGTEHRVGAHVVEAALFVVLLKARLHRGYVAEDAVFLGQIGDDLVKYLQCVFEADGVDDEVCPEVAYLFQRGEPLGVVHETKSLGVYVIDCHFVVERQQVGEERPHLACS